MLTTARNASLSELHELLSVQHDAKHDAVVPANSLHYEGGNLVARGMGLDGPARGARPGVFTPTEQFDAHVADQLQIPLAYVRRMRAERVDLLDTNVNGWLHRDTRKFFVRTFLDTRDEHLSGNREGIARAMLSDRYRRVDNLDVITAVLSGIRESGVKARVASCNLTERRMRVKIVCPEVALHAPELLRGYRDPFGHDPQLRAQRRKAWSERTGIDIDEFGDGPIVFAGFSVTNSETGDGAASIWPEITIVQCLNGQVFAKDVMRNVHLGARLNEGVVNWSDETQQKNLELVMSMTTDAVRTFVDESYVARKVAELEESAGAQITNPEGAVELVAQTLRFSEEQRAGIFSHFIRGGQVTAGGVMQAITSYAQTVEDADEQWDLELQALPALTLAATGARAGRF